LLERHIVKKSLEQIDEEEKEFLSQQQDLIDAENKLHRENISKINNMD
jgi:hypothetical protein